VEGEPHVTLSQVALNDTIMVGSGLRADCGAAARPVSITVPWNKLLLSVVHYIVVPVIVVQFWRTCFWHKAGRPCSSWYLI
jgi:arsenite transporter